MSIIEYLFYVHGVKAVALITKFVVIDGEKLRTGIKFSPLKAKASMIH